MTDMQQVVSWSEAIANICNAVETDGRFVDDDGRLEMSISRETPEIWVRDLQTGFLVAYSSMRADYISSLEEFANDYFLD